MLKRSVFALLVLLNSHFALAYPTIGISVANSAVETLIVSAPLPNLDGGAAFLTPQYGNIQTELTNKPGLDEGISPKPSYSGKVSGNSAGLGYTLPSRGDLSFVIYGTGANQSGEFAINYDTAPTVNYTEFQANGGAVFAAGQYRLVGDDKSFFAMGLFGGPGYYSFQTSVTYNQAGSGPPPSKVTFNPSGAGMLTGFQMMFRLGNFRINPYFMGFSTLGDLCHKLEIPSGGQLDASGFTCGDKTGYAEVPSGFGGIGINLGYKAIKFNVYTFFPAQEVKPLSVTSFSLSYAIKF